MTYALLRPLLTAAVVGLSLASAAWAQPQAPATDSPMLRIDTGAHEARLGAAAADAARRVLVTTGDDKIALVWSLPDLRPLGALRPPAGTGEDGRLYAAAVSPDGKLAAVGGWTPDGAGGYAVFVFDLVSKQIVHRLAGLGGAVIALAFSSDGARLAVGLYGDKGIRVWRVSGDWPLVAEDRDYTGSVLGLDFAADGRLAASAWDGAVRLYNRVGRRVRRVSTEIGHQPDRISFAPDGRRLAVGFSDAPVVEVRDGETLALLARPDTAGLEAGRHLHRVAWSADGETLFAGGWTGTAGRWPIFAWGQRGTGPRGIGASGWQTLIPSGIVPLADGRMIATAEFGNITLFPGGPAQAGAGLSPMAEVWPERQDLNRAWALNHPTRRLRLSQDGVVVEWAPLREAAGRVRRFDAAQAVLEVDTTWRPGLEDWVDRSGDLTATDWDGRPSPRFNGHPIALRSTENAFAASVAHGRLLLGTALSLRMVAADGREQWRRGVPGLVLRVNQSANARLAVAAYGDGTIRWHRADNGRELLALFVTADGERWVAWTPSGYYTASPGGEDLIGWSVNNGRDRAADFYGASRFRARFYRPDVVRLALEAMDEAEAVRRADRANRDGGTAAVPATPTPAAAELHLMLPPVVRILAPADGAKVVAAAARPEVSIEYVVRSPSGRPLRAIRALVDGRPVEGVRGLEPVPMPPPAGEAQGQAVVPVPAAAAEREVVIALIAEGEGGVAGEPARVRVRVPAFPATGAASPPASGRQDSAAQAPALLPRLNAVLVGVSDYPNPEHRLAFAAKDARDVAAALEAQRGHGLYREVNLRLVTDREATRAGVLRALDWLRRETTSNDVAAVFLAGHGLLDEGRTFFLPADGDPEQLFATAVAQSDLQGILSRVAGRVVAFVDICHAGAAVLAQGQRGVRVGSAAPPDMTAFVNQLREPGSGLVVFAAATARQPAVELRTLGNGAFTAALLEGLRGGADLNRDGAVRTDELNVFVADRVRALTGGRQHPVMQRPGDIPDFPFAVALPRAAPAARR